MQSYIEWTRAKRFILAFHKLMQVFYKPTFCIYLRLCMCVCVCVLTRYSPVVMPSKPIYLFAP